MPLIFQEDRAEFRILPASLSAMCIENGNNERVGKEAHKNYSNNWEEIDLTGLKDLSIKSTHGYSHQINDRSLKS